jgi:hypothetical protein
MYRDRRKEMKAFLLEKLFDSGWKLEGPVFWTLPLASKEAGRLIRRKLARRVRVRPVTISETSIAEVPGDRAESEAVPC